MKYKWIYKTLNRIEYIIIDTVGFLNRIQAKIKNLRWDLGDKWGWF